MIRNLGLTLRKRRFELGFTIEEVAQRCGVSKNLVWMWEHNMRSPSVKVLWALANALALDINELALYKIESASK